LKYPNTIHQKNFSWCKSPITSSHFPFDFYIKEINCIVELDGGQHFKQVKDWDAPEYTQKKDVWKMQQANKHKISVIRIYQEDVLNNNEMWLDENLLPYLKKYKEPTNTYIADRNHGDLYANHKEMYSEKIVFDETVEEVRDLDEI
jgi:Marseilleviridae restriction endonuclease